MLKIDHAVKSFGATLALDDVSLALAAGEIVGLLGENGAGKTTLMRAAAGEIALDSGAVERPAQIGFVHQHFTIVPAFSIAENLALTRREKPFVTRRSLETAAEEEISRSGVKLPDVTRLARDLPIGEKAKLELIKAVARRPEFLILDEPTSVLTPMESAELFELIRQLAAAGTAVVFISHKVPEVLEIAKRIVVMRRGKVVTDQQAAGMTATDIANVMVPGGGGQAILPDRGTDKIVCPPLLSAQHLSGVMLTDVSLTVRKHEVISILGVAGNGQSELAEIIRGIRAPRAGAIDIAAGTTGFIPEDRTRNALIAEMTIAENISLGAPRWNARQSAKTAADIITTYGIKARGPHQIARELSGGNQQKVVLARELSRQPELIIAAEPTRGLDIDATAFVHRQLVDAVERGAGLLLITSDLDEAFALSDGVHVIYRGKLSERMTVAEAREKVATLMAGVA